jgi:hypothetical protein
MMDAMNGAGRLFVSDASAVLLELNDARRRLLTRLTGLSELSGGESLVLTLLALGAVAKMFDDANPVRVVGPSGGDLVIGSSVLSEIVHGIAGGASRAVPGFSALAALALIWRYHPLARGSWIATRGTAHVMEATERKLRAYYQQLSKLELGTS